MSELPEKIPLLILDSNESPAFLITHYTKWVADLPSFPNFELEFFIIDSPKGEYLILGYVFLYHFDPVIDWENALITYDSSGFNSSSSNALATSVNSVALVGELKTPSLPSSVHILSIIPFQLLLKSRDEVFKEIKDVAYLHFISFKGIWNSLLYCFMPPWRSSGMRRKSQNKLKLCWRQSLILITNIWMYSPR
ncbi:hypothetical protein O181_065641 [Austropuccinia psidii MF-1]|uniref:Uncharacterized protein n=1 Tax=Austropuccinia psidii MF-1 TaxID=1389203 RepID=A0A9Q3I1E0_9BASI|nr:hypothetical protein [Austropuccinia psidii MF-1]